MSEQTKSIKTHPSYNKVVKNYNKSFSMYAETDLDQPTDYSLRYAEDDSDSSEEDNNTDECNKTNKSTTTTTTNNEFIQDTIKTYCTEDTPYETPFNFSTATSMSDLRIDDKQIDKSDNNDDATTQNDNNKDTEKKIVKSEYSSGLMSPEKPINYCEEGTPGYFSRVPSLSSLNSIPINENETTSPPPPPPLPQPSTTKIDQKIETKIVKETKRSSEVKAVKFEEVVNYAEETPLMFSRSSSLASLDSIEQHSIHDDRSSVISDFSRLTSGLVSPSELPDSPTQTIPSSPKSRLSKQQKSVVGNAIQTPPKANIFEDTVKKFKLESTPIQFSRATSLSSLTIDEQEREPQPQQPEDEQLQAPQEEASPQQHDDHEKIGETDGKHEENCDHSDEELEKLDLNDHNDNSGSSEEDDDILAACINIGIQNNRYSQQKSSCSSPDLPSTYNYPQNKLNNLNQHWLEEDKKNVASNDLNISLETNLGNSSISSEASSESGEAALLEECILAGMPKKTNVPSNTLSIKSNELTEAEQALLQQCILDGMKKSRLSPKKQLNSHKTNDLTESERSLLQQCIMAGMQKNNRSNNNNNHHHHHRPSTSKDTTNTELTYAERQMLEQCILEGMPKSNRSVNNNRPTTTTNTRRFRDYERLSQTTNEHTCCIHCPRNQQKQLMLRQNSNNHLRMKKKNRNYERTTQIHINKENKDVNILYVTSQILALKKEMIDRSHEEWV